MDIWNEVVLTVSSSNLEKAEAIVTVVSQKGIYVEDYSDMLNMLPLIGHYDYINEELLKKDTDLANIHLYISDDENLSDSLEFIQDRFHTENIPYTIIFKTVRETDWEESWKQYFHPRRIGKQIIICPSWEDYKAEDNDIIITLDPGMSFGTGDHESTQLALILLEDCFLTGNNVLDVGSGSGILGIAAAKLGSRSITAIDIDPIAVDISRKNAFINDVDDRFTVICGDICNDVCSSSLHDCFDLITANVVADFHIANMKFYYEKLVKNGSLIISGIIEAQLDEVVLSLMDENFTVIEKRNENGWCAILAKKGV